LMNSVGLFLEESEEKDFLGIFSFVVLSYLLVPFQAYASIKGLLEEKEGPWFRTPKTGRITDLIKRGSIYRWLFRGPKFSSAHSQVEAKQNMLPVFIAGTSHRTFQSFRILPRRFSVWVAMIVLGSFSLSSFLFYLPLSQGVARAQDRTEIMERTTETTKTYDNGDGTLTLESTPVQVPEITDQALPVRKEAVDKRTQFSKTFENTDGTKTWEGSVGVMHYKEDYSSPDESWKDVDLRLIEYEDVFKVEKAPVKIEIFRSQIGYRVTSRRSGQSMMVELESIDGVKENGVLNLPIVQNRRVVFQNAWSLPLDFEFEITATGVRLWKILKTSEAPQTFTWKITTEGKDETTLLFREEPEAFDADERAVPIQTVKLPLDEGVFFWQESMKESHTNAIRYPVRIDTDIYEQIGASADDADEPDEGTTDISDTSLILGWNASGSVNQHVGVRFQTVNVPQGADIYTASLTLREHDSLTSGDTAPTLTIYGEDVDDSSAFTATSKNIENRTRTSASTSWSPSIP
ncbi:MAG TPA: hypothetical protein VJ044_02995, partial [Candidatus Hodarchaeales archaeon]|nr:hypothetical protein [Candidatus Hodarchaeales archaeon]